MVLQVTFHLGSSLLEGQTFQEGIVLGLCFTPCHADPGTVEGRKLTLELSPFTRFLLIHRILWNTQAEVTLASDGTT